MSNDAKLEVVFSMVRVGRSDPDEQFLVASLLRSEPDLLGSDEPMAFAVFGRGRILWALIGGGINEDTIHKACEFICGPCACVVKGENPGVDMLLSADWPNTPLGSSISVISAPACIRNLMANC